MKKIGLFFGSFNPIHNGHATIAQSSLEQFKLDAIWFVVSPQNPFKSHNKDLADEQKRFNLVELFCNYYGNEKFQAAGLELYMDKPSYTSKTLQTLKSNDINFFRPKTTYYLIMGSDTIHQLKQWKEYEYIIENFGILLYERIGGNYEIPNLNYKFPIQKINAPIIDLSSTLIRKRIKKKLPIDFYVPSVLKENILKIYS